MFSTFSKPLLTDMTIRMRRNRRHDWLRHLVCETSLSAQDIIWPLFVREDSIEATIHRMPGVHRYMLSELIDQVGRALDLGLQAVALFPVIAHDKRDEYAQESLNEDGILYQAIRILKKTFPQLGVITDVALDAYTSHGHDGLYHEGDVANDESVHLMAQFALRQAQAGADIIAPSDMMDGRVGEIRKTLDQHRLHNVGIMSYAVKYNSNFYGPFREALGSEECLAKGHKRTYHMDPANTQEALREVSLDLKEGADSVIIKPGLPFLDIIRQVKDQFGVPTFAYHVSGEYSMLKAASDAGMINYEKTLIEIMTCFKRAGANAIITYNAVDVLTLIKQG